MFFIFFIHVIIIIIININDDIIFFYFTQSHSCPNTPLSALRVEFSRPNRPVFVNR